MSYVVLIAGILASFTSRAETPPLPEWQFLITIEFSDGKVRQCQGNMVSPTQFIAPSSCVQAWGGVFNVSWRGAEYKVLPTRMFSENGVTLADLDTVPFDMRSYPTLVSAPGAEKIGYPLKDVPVMCGTEEVPMPLDPKLGGSGHYTADKKLDGILFAAKKDPDPAKVQTHALNLYACISSGIADAVSHP